MEFHLYYQSEDCTGSRAYDPGPLCGDKKPAGVAVQTLKTRDCSYAVTEAVELGDYLSSGHTSNKGLSTFCTIVSTEITPHLLSIGKTLNPDEAFVTLERKLED